MILTNRPMDAGRDASSIRQVGVTQLGEENKDGTDERSEASQESMDVDEKTNDKGVQTEPIPSRRNSSADKLDLTLSVKLTDDKDPWDLDNGSERLPAEETQPSVLQRENRMYKELLTRFCGYHMHPRSKVQPRIEMVEPYETDRLDMRPSWRTHIGSHEELYLLRNALVQVDGKYREGHGILQIVYFPHVSERARCATREATKQLTGSTDTLILEEDNPPPVQRGVWPRLTMNDLQQSMEEIAFEIRDRVP